MRKLSESEIRARLPRHLQALRIDIFDRLQSTNDAASEAIIDGRAPEFVVVLAEEQSGGRGRRGRVWSSPPKQGLLVSFAFSYPHGTPVRVEEWPLFAALTVRQMIEETSGVPAKIKWPNDILVDGRKICGILTELGTGTYQRYLVIGIGINVNTAIEDFPPEVCERADSLAHMTGREHDRNELAARLIERMHATYLDVLRGLNFAALRSEWLSHCSSIGQRARIAQGFQTLEGFVETIDERGSLLLVDEQGKRHTLISGEIIQTYTGGAWID